MRKSIVGGLVGAALAIGGVSLAEGPGAGSKPKSSESGAAKLGKDTGGAGMDHVIVPSNKDIKWGEGPPTLPKGIKATVIEGDPSVANKLFMMRALVPAGTKIMPHYHGTDEHLTVITGEAKVGMGEKFDEKAMTTLAPGGFFMMPAGHRHYFMVTKETVIQLHGLGPWSITYVNPDDDPRRGVGGSGEPVQK